MITTVKLSEVIPNPNNPRQIKDEKFKKLVESIKNFPKMLSFIVTGKQIGRAHV